MVVVTLCFAAVALVAVLPLALALASLINDRPGE